MVSAIELQLARGTPVELTVPGRDRQRVLNRELVLRAWLWGYLTARQEVEGELLRRRGMYSDPPSLDWIGPPPREAIEWLASREILLGKWERDLDDQVTAILVQALETGATRKEISAALARVFPNFSGSRLENIARTETTAALTQGRLKKFLEPGSRVAGVQFVAILDARTTMICRSRDGLIMRLNDPRLAYNTPPLHFYCRSTLVPVSQWDWDDLLYGDPDAEERFFGYLEPGAPRNLAEALAGWKRAEDPSPGFGQVGKAKRRRKAAPVAEPAEETAQSTDFSEAISKRLGAGVNNPSDVRDLGRLALDEIKTLVGDTSKLQKANEKARERFKKALLVSNTSFGRPSIERAKLYKEALEAQQRYADTREALANARNGSVLQVLGRVVEFAGEKQAWDKGTARKTRAAYDEIDKFLPTKWVKESNAFGALVGRHRKDRGDSGSYGHNKHRGQSSITVSGATDFGLRSTLLHEYGHRIENVRPGLAKLIFEYFDERTKGDKAEPLIKYMPGVVSPGVKVKRDKWTEPYFGRLYKHEAVEIFAMGLEGAFFSQYTLWEKDEALLEFILGAIIAL